MNEQTPPYREGYEIADLWADLSPESDRFFPLLCQEFALEDPEEADLRELMSAIRDEVDRMAYDPKKQEWIGLSVDDLFFFNKTSTPPATSWSLTNLAPALSVNDLT